MIFKPFYRDETGCAAYVFGCGGRGLGAVVDPQERDVDAYADYARAKGLRITHVIDTHVHADHRSGGRRLAEITGARYCLHRAADGNATSAWQSRPCSRPSAASSSRDMLRSATIVCASCEGTSWRPPSGCSDWCSPPSLLSLVDSALALVPEPEGL